MQPLLTILPSSLLNPVMTLPNAPRPISRSVPYTSEYVPAVRAASSEEGVSV